MTGNNSSYVPAICARTPPSACLLYTSRANAARLELDEEAVAREVDAWRAAGYPALSHSGVYRALYHPAYRLVPEATERFLALFQAIDALLERKGRARVAIDGNSGAGKSTLGALLAAVYGGNLYHMDDFFLPCLLYTSRCV